jgi:ethanolamine ammonia-lyase small subunit
MNNREFNVVDEDPWQSLKKYTHARIALGRCGSSVPTNELLEFRLAHARAIDAVHLPFRQEHIAREIENIVDGTVLRLQSAAKDRYEYLKRPDLGRLLSDESIRLIQYHMAQAPQYDISLVVADGLSSTAIEKNILPMLQRLIPMLKKRNFVLSPIAVVEQGRVAIADAIAELLHTKLTVMFIGERPGLKSPDSLGIYMTYNPKIGTTDERRNCISNVRQDGLSYPLACSKLIYLVEESLKRSISGVALKDEQTDSDMLYLS